jgi:hypothetical protein
MNYSKIKSILNRKEVSMHDVAFTLSLTRQAVYRLFSVESMTVKQLEMISSLIESNPGEFFDDHSYTMEHPLPQSQQLVSALNDKIKLQSDIISLLREQLEDCKTRIVKPALVK